MEKCGCPTMVRGHLYPSQSAVARRFGVRVQTVWAAVERGTTDKIGLGKGANRMPVWINGIKYPSETEASLSHGKHRSFVSNRRRTAMRHGVTAIDSDIGRIEWR